MQNCQKMTDIAFVTDTIYRKSDIKNADSIRHRYRYNFNILPISSSDTPTGQDTPLALRYVPRFWLRTVKIMPLKGIPFILSPDLLYVLSAAGHGDEIGE